MSIFVFSMFAMSSSFAADSARDVQQFINEQVRMEETIRAQAEPPSVNYSAPQVTTQDRSFIEQMKTRKQDMFKPATKPVPQAIYFVSFSIPTAGLKRMIAEADRFHIPANIRGMVGENMTSTMEAVSELVAETNRGGVNIDPQAFRTYGIENVPVLVVTCGENQFDRIGGNLRLREALERIAKEGECHEVAERILQGVKS
ncbi:type-F conjugative transfer system pilin assembly protein TrbC [Budviciaceae bacterium BWR-B9]|uniref:Type-F conjugative transfer system pilin assembly protein TrbC n=2 Tax=Budviciaceae TaxID=1903416 RepID=A0ABS1IUV6_9GAMM|nr:type-F conjugative transfer system pilin assembly protein TrbC [Limnobaculum allomyrinae]